MAQRRMFNKIVTNNDNFLEMPDSSQNLYFHLSMNADDDGFVDNWKAIMRMTGHKEDDLKVLIAKQFVIPFESGVIVIRHWRLNNYLRNDRFSPTNYKEEMKLLKLDENMVYQLDTNGIPNVYPDKIRLDKNRLDKNSIEYVRHKFGTYGRVHLTEKQYNKLIEDFSKELVDKKIEQLDEYVEMNNNKNKYKNFNLVLRKAIRENWFENNNSKQQKTKLELQRERQQKIMEDFVRGETK